MSVSSVTSTSSSYSTCNVQSDFKQRMDDFKALKTALQSGDLSAAQSAFATFKQDIQNVQKSGQTSNNSKPAQDFQALESALSSGDMSAAQKAFTTMQSDMRGAHRAHHHHHKSSGDGDTQVQSASGSSSATSAIGTILNQQA